jgi:two-component system, OmpR family, sensor histidine kinase KdpD
LLYDGGMWSRYLATVALVALATATGVFLRGHLAAPDLVMLYLLVICAVATLGRGPSLLACALSVSAFDYFFVPPFHTFAVADERYLLTFGTLFVVGLLLSALMSRVRAQEREAGEREKRTAAAELRARTEEMRSSLLSAVSHDLRTPLAAITGAATTLREAHGDISDAQRAELADTICEEAERLERFVVNLLEMTRLQAGTLEVKREWVPLEELVGSALTRLEARLEGRPVHAPLPADLPLISVDPVLLEQVFFNLLENAAKHTPPGTPVEISARASRGQLVVEVSDRGPGIPPGAESLVFDKFYRAAPGGTRGAGLGLAVCRGIVQAHGGTITAENRPEGGATFRLTLPLQGEAPSVPAEPEHGGLPA